MNRLIDEKRVRRSRTRRTCDNDATHIIPRGRTYWRQYVLVDGHDTPRWYALCVVCKAQQRDVARPATRAGSSARQKGRV